MDRFIAVTGGPGSGKSTLIEALAARGFARSTEAGRAIIQDQVASGGDALPWADREAFAALMLDHRGARRPCPVRSRPARHHRLPAALRPPGAGRPRPGGPAPAL